MAKSVFTGWRTVTPGACTICGFDTDWEVDGRGSVYCSCQWCPDCEEVGEHAQWCSENPARCNECNECPCECGAEILAG